MKKALGIAVAAVALGIGAYYARGRTVSFQVPLPPPAPLPESPGATAGNTGSAADAPRVFTEEAFAAETATGVTLLDFTATWCPPCRMMEPILGELEEAANGRYRVVAVDVDVNETLATRFEIKGMPTFVVLRDGRETERFEGTRPKEVLAAALEKAIAAEPPPL